MGRGWEPRAKFCVRKHDASSGADISNMWAQTLRALELDLSTIRRPSLNSTKDRGREEKNKRALKL